MYRRFLIQLAMAATAIVPLVSKADTWEDVTKSKVMRVAVLQDFPPFGSVGTDMTPRGYDIDVANLVAKKLGVQAQFVPVSGANRFPYLQTRKVDIIIACLGRNAEREKVVDYGMVYAVTYNATWGLKSQKVSEAADLAGKTIAVPRGSTEEADLVKVAPPTAVIKRFDDSNGSVTAFLSGQSDLLVSSNTLMATVLARNPGRPIESKIRFHDEKVYIGFAKGEGRFKAEVDAAISEMKRDGSLSELAVKWFGAPLPEGL